MNYQETTDWLFLPLPMFQQQGKKGIKKIYLQLYQCKSPFGPENRFKSTIQLETEKDHFFHVSQFQKRIKSDYIHHPEAAHEKRTKTPTTFLSR
jgi:hypothetical protein